MFYLHLFTMPIKTNNMIEKKLIICLVSPFAKVFLFEILMKKIQSFKFLY